jgi:lysophospholipase L1-like esterase
MWTTPPAAPIAAAGAPRRLAAKLGIVAACLLLSLLLAEAIVALTVSGTGAGIHFAARQRGCCQIDPELIWTFRPNVSGTWGTDEFQETSAINSLGMRDHEVAPKRAGERRIVAIGDSFTYGHGVQLEESYPKVVERRLAERGVGEPPVTVLNAGQPGYGMDQIYKSFVLRRLALEPDLVLVGVHTTDVTIDVDKSLFGLHDGALVPLDARHNWIHVQGTILEYLPRFVAASQLARLALSALQNVPALRQTPPLSEAQLYDWQRDKAVAEITALRDLGKQRGFRVAVVLMPSEWALRDPGWEPFGDLAVRLRAREIPVLELLRGLGGSTSDQFALFFPKDKHLNVQGNRVLGELVTDFVIAQRLLDGSSGATPG